MSRSLLRRFSAATGPAALLPWAAGALVLLARLWRLTEAPLPDYDSARNWLTIQALANGQWTDLFRHASPTYYLLHLPLADWLAADFHRGQVLNALLSAGAAVLLARLVGRRAALPPLDTALLTLLIGLGTNATFSGRDFAITSPALLISVGVLWFYEHRLRCLSWRALLGATALLAIGLTINYKLVLLLPVAALLEWRHRPDGVLTVRRALWLGAVLLAPFVVYMSVAVAVGLPWWRLPATWVGIVLPRTANAAGRGGTVSPDLGFYLLYLLRFESPLLLIGLLSGPWLIRTAHRRGAPLEHLLRLSWWLSASLLALLTFFIKAPRGLSFAYGPLMALGALAIWQVCGPDRRGIARALLGLALVGQVAGLWLHLWRFYPPLPLGQTPPYQQVATYLWAHGARHVPTTAGLALAPYATPLGIRVEASTTPAALVEALAQGTAADSFLLLDGHRYALALNRLNPDSSGATVLRFREPSWCCPLLWLEHAEYTGRSFNQTLQACREQQTEAAELRLVVRRR